MTQNGPGQEEELQQTYRGMQDNQIWNLRGTVVFVGEAVSSYKFPFFCFNLMVVETKKTWEQALLYCRETHTDLTSLASTTEQRLAMSEIQHDNVTQRVWIGLHYLADRWLWVNDDPLDYEDWPQGDQDHLCPIRGRCGALTKEGLWENWDCQDQLNFICY